ncbi:MAG TPA: HipA family kinase [Candidatus Saccharimonadales bacterium]|nr:HipA family kinase [Candidatus Saccharimonadales bacterium]
MLRAIEQIRRMRGGAQSHLMRCTDNHYYVVKFQNNPQHRRVLVNELLGTRLASRLGLPTAPVDVVDVPGELIRLTPELCIETPRTRIPCAPGSSSVRAIRATRDA